ncbi:MAG TPA: DUF4157 domain-containing protein [Gallionella sp.]|nr:DUF4157 domain-containing protein [Gallionella sp.]
MQKAEPQQNHAQNQPAQRQGIGAALESPQGEQIAQLEAAADASPQANRLAQLAAMANNSPRMAAQRKAISAIHNSPNVTAQRQQIDSLTGETAQREETEEPLQPKVAQREAAPAKPNASTRLSTGNTGLPDNLKNGIESLSGISMDSVKVHYNSSQPAQLNALAYAQGTDIHVAPGQEQHLPHEAWHVVQQAQGRVRPTMQMKAGVPVNDDKSLEHEADVTGEKAASDRVLRESALIGSQSGATQDGTGKQNGELFEAHGEQHTLWVENIGGRRVIMIASTPVPVPTRLRKWEAAAKKVKDVPLKNGMTRLLSLAWQKYKALQDASEIEDVNERGTAIQLAQHNLRSDLGQLFRIFGEVFEAPPGAVAVYRGLHFTTDWNTKRGRTVDQENARTFEQVKGEGSYSTASWELAAIRAAGAKITPEMLEAATQTVMATMQGWKTNTDFTREDDSDLGIDMKKRRNKLPGQIAHAQQHNLGALEIQHTNSLEGMKKTFTQGKYAYGNQYDAALSRYIDSQKLFEGEMGAGSKGGYKDIPFKSIPFISTSKDAKEAVKYGMGKLANDGVKNTAGTVGRVLVYVAPLTAMLEAGGIDVWEGLRNGTLNFTNYRKNENEITFPGSIPDDFLGGMTPIEATKSIDENAIPPQSVAAKKAAPMGGLNPLPLNEDI